MLCKHYWFIKVTSHKIVQPLFRGFCIPPPLWWSILCGLLQLVLEGKSVPCSYVHSSPNSATAVLASFCWAASDLPLSHFRVPPNVMTCVCPSPKLKAVAVCHIRGCPPSGRLSWGSESIVWQHNYVTFFDLKSPLLKFLILEFVVSESSILK